MLKYKLVERGKPGDPDAPKKLYASPVKTGFSSEGVADEADFHTSKIKGLKVIFTPGKLIKEELKRAKFNK